jgi:hypothetical protein
VTFKTWLGRQLRELLNEPPDPPPPPPMSNPESIPSSPIPNTRVSQPTSAEPDMLVRLVEMMSASQRETMREVRGMVMDILQGRERPPLSEEEQLLASRTPFDPPNYDSPGTEDLPEGIAAVFNREEQETIDYRSSHSERELLNDQLERARAIAGLNPQGPAAEPSFSTESIGLQPEDLRFR